MSTPAKSDGKAAAPRKDVLLDHEYDGIREYDNPLPGWWLFLFWVPILFAPFYLVYYHGKEGRLVVDEYTRDAGEIAEARAKEALKNPISDAGLLEQSKDPGTAAAGASIFAAKCAQCHGPQGQGGIGPNLADKFWINGGKPTQIFHTISEGGRPGKGMIAWSKEGLNAVQLRVMAAYVLSLQGSNPPNPKPPEGTELKE
ncbi:MAG: cbb3-type cytochrome c oxidase N-terminal domain-containing protein [Planctomycetota bacterium]